MRRPDAGFSDALGASYRLLEKQGQGALDVAAECTVLADVGNLTDVASNPFDIVTRGGGRHGRR